MSEQAPRVSFIVPCYNSGRTIRECLSSVLAQSVGELEAVVIDDGSTDDTVEIVRGMAARDDRIRLLTPGHGGVSAARNHGLRRACGEWITFLDSDDTIPADYAQHMIGLAEKEQAVYLISWRNPYVDDETPELKDGAYAVRRVKEMAEPICNNWQSYIGGKLFRRDILSEGGICFREGIHYAEDTLLAMDYLLACSADARVVLLNAQLYRYVVSPAGLRNRRKNKAAHLELLREQVMRFAERFGCDRERLDAWWHYRRLEMMLDVSCDERSLLRQYRCVREYIRDPAARAFMTRRAGNRRTDTYHRVLLCGSPLLFVLYTRLRRLTGKG